MTCPEGSVALRDDDHGAIDEAEEAVLPGEDTDTSSSAAGDRGGGDASSAAPICRACHDITRSAALVAFFSILASSARRVPAAARAAAATLADTSLVTCAVTSAVTRAVTWEATRSASAPPGRHESASAAWRASLLATRDDSARSASVFSPRVSSITFRCHSRARSQHLSAWEGRRGVS